MHQSKALFTVFVKNKRKPFQKQHARSWPYLLQQTVEDIGVGLLVDFLVNDLTEGNDSVAHC
jgi:hypothetical protein